MLDYESASSRYHVCQFLGKTENLEFSGPNLPNIGCWGLNFTNLSPDLELAPQKYHLCQFSVKMDNFEFFHPNLGKLQNYVRYFGSNNVESVADSWMEVQMI